PLKQLDRYTEAELMAAVLAACFTVFIKHPTPDAPVGLGLPAGQLPPADPAQYRLGNGAILDLAAGESVRRGEPGRPNDRIRPVRAGHPQQVGVARGAVRAP
ncbi:MAG: phage portal protein, partial [Gemmatimonadetes bacterium]|nr:phage portal protein [Gemmatimonadota bacterium]